MHNKTLKSKTKIPASAKHSLKKPTACNKHQATAKKKKHKPEPDSCSDYLLVNGKLYRVETPSDRLKLQFLQPADPLDQKVDSAQYRQPSTSASKPSFHKKERSLDQEINLLSVPDKRVLLVELESEIRARQLLKWKNSITQQLQQIHENIDAKHSKVMHMLGCVLSSKSISELEFEEKKEIMERITQRKHKILKSVEGMFQRMLDNPEQLEVPGEISVSHLIFSLNEITNRTQSSQSAIDLQNQIQEDRHTLLNHLKSRLELKLKLQINEQEQQHPSTTNIPKPTVESTTIHTSTHNNMHIKLGDEQHPNQKQSDEDQGQQQDSKQKRPFVIPLIITADRKEQIEKQRRVAEQRQAELSIQRRIAFQLGYTFVDGGPVRTYLPAVSWYIESFTNYLLQNYLEDIIELMKTSYGKSAFEKMQDMRDSGPGASQQFDLPFILSEELFSQFQLKRLAKDSDMPYQFRELDSFHSKAIFDALNSAINIYRPYYAFNGAILPWIVTEKGMTFYSIDEDNIEQVFEKSKIKILEMAASLCGVHYSEGEDLSRPAVKQTYEKKREQLLRRTINAQIMEEAEEWLAIDTQDAKLRMLLSDDLLEKLIEEVASYYHLFHNSQSPQL